VILAVDVIPLPPFEVLVARVLLTGATLGLFTYDWSRAFRQYVSKTDRRKDGSAFRALIRSSVLMLGLLVVFLGTLNGAFFADEPTIREGLRFAGTVVLGMLLVGGIGLVGSWKGVIPSRFA
jgi:hypothetical protein